jgi:hypothetical protein
MCWSINQGLNEDEGRFIYDNICFHKVLNIFMFYLTGHTLGKEWEASVLNMCLCTWFYPTRVHITPQHSEHDIKNKLPFETGTWFNISRENRNCELL